MICHDSIHMDTNDTKYYLQKKYKYVYNFKILLAN